MIQQTQARDGKFDLPSLWDLMKQVAFYDLGGFTNYTILYRTDTMQFGLAKSDETGFSVDKQPVWFDLADLLSYTPPDDDAASDDDAADDDAAPPHADNGDDNSGCGC